MEHDQNIFADELKYMEQFRLWYVKRNPPPVRDVYASNNKLIYGALGALVSSSVVVSAYHTIPIFVGENLNVVTGLVGFAVFVMVELAIVFLAYTLIRMSYDRDEQKDKPVGGKALFWLRVGLVMVVAVALGTNLYSTTKEAGFAHPLATLAISVIAGLSAPVMALVSGEVLAMTVIEGMQRQRVLDADFAAAQVDYQNDFLKAWDARKSKVLASVRAEPSAQLSERTPDAVRTDTGHRTRTDGANRSGQGYSRDADAAKKVLAHFEQHPADYALSLRALAEKLSVSKTTVGDAKKAYTQRTTGQPDNPDKGE